MAMILRRKNASVNEEIRSPAVAYARGDSRMATNKARADGWSEDFRDRFQTVIEQLGGTREAASVGECSHDMIVAYREGRSKIPAIVAARLCESAGKSIDWLMFGPSRGVPDDAIPVDVLKQAWSVWMTVLFRLEERPTPDAAWRSFLEDLRQRMRGD